MAQRMVTMDPFCLRQFVTSGTRAVAGQIAFDPMEFASHINAAIALQGGSQVALKPGYAPFCKHVFVENFCGGKGKSRFTRVQAAVVTY
jgi:hypothetical protein